MVDQVAISFFLWAGMRPALRRCPWALYLLALRPDYSEPSSAKEPKAIGDAPDYCGAVKKAEIHPRRVFREDPSALTRRADDGA